MGDQSNFVVQAKSLELKFQNGPHLFDKINFDIRAGERIALVGPSGSGKSYLLKVIAGLREVDQGELKLWGLDWLGASATDKEKISYKMGMLFQKNALFDSLTVRENIAFPLRRRQKKLSEDEIQKKVMHFLQAVGLDTSADLMPSELSGGMQKRLGIARAVALDPELILYDDPTAGLDPITSRKIIQLLISLQEASGHTAIAMTNEMTRAFQFGHRIWYLGSGQLVDLGSPDQAKNFTDANIKNFIHGVLD